MSTKLIKVGRVPGTVTEVAVDNGYSVQQVCEQANIDPAGLEVRVNGRVTELSGSVQNGDTILLAEKIKGAG